MHWSLSLRTRLNLVLLGTLYQTFGFHERKETLNNSYLLKMIRTAAAHYNLKSVRSKRSQERVKIISRFY
jgi:hypothetical protein